MYTFILQTCFEFRGISISINSLYETKSQYLLHDAVEFLTKKIILLTKVLISRSGSCRTTKDFKNQTPMSTPIGDENRRVSFPCLETLVGIFYVARIRYSREFFNRQIFSQKHKSQDLTVTKFKSIAS